MAGACRRAVKVGDPGRQGAVGSPARQSRGGTVVLEAGSAGRSVGRSKGGCGLGVKGCVCVLMSCMAVVVRPHRAGVPGGLVGGPRAYQDQFCAFESNRVHAYSYEGTFSCIKLDWRKARERE